MLYYTTKDVSTVNNNVMLSWSKPSIRFALSIIKIRYINKRKKYWQFIPRYDIILSEIKSICHHVIQNKLISTNVHYR